jgi:hypothetical protein
MLKPLHAIAHVLLAAAAISAVMPHMTAAACDRTVVVRQPVRRVVQLRPVVTETVTEVRITTPAPQPKAVHRYEISAGATISVLANFLGQEPGYVTLHVGGTVLQADVLKWESNRVLIRLPAMGVEEPRDARLSILLPSGETAKSLNILLINPDEIVVHEEGVRPLSESSRAGATGAENLGIFLR